MTGVQILSTISSLPANTLQLLGTAKDNILDAANGHWAGVLRGIEVGSQMAARRIEGLPERHPLNRFHLQDAKRGLERAICGAERFRAPSHYRAREIYLSPNIGSETLPILPGFSETVPLGTKPGLRVLFTAHFPLDSNGSGTYTRAMAAYVARSGGEARILSVGNHFSGDLPESVGEYLLPFTPHDAPPRQGAARAFFPVLDTNPQSPYGIRFRDMSPRALAAYADGFADAVATAAKHMRPDVLVVNHAFLGALAARRTGIPFVVVGHGSCSNNMAQALDSKNRYPANLGEFVLPAVTRASRIVAITDEVGDDIRNIYGVDPERIVTIPNGFHRDIFYPRPDLNRNAVLRSLGVPTQGTTHVVSFAGRMVPYKGVSTLIEAAQIVAARFPGVRFVLAGNGSARETFETQAANAGLGKHFFFVRHQPLENLAKLHGVADIGIVPSWVEPFGIVPLEIAGTGTPVIASDVGGMRMTVTAEVGRRVPPQNAWALANAIIEALHQDLKGQMGHHAAKHVHANFPWEACANRLFGLLRDVVEEFQRAPAKDSRTRNPATSRLERKSPAMA